MAKDNKNLGDHSYNKTQQNKIVEDQASETAGSLSSMAFRPCI